MKSISFSLQLLLLGLVGLASCGVVDTREPERRAAQDVRPYYYNLDAHVEYLYSYTTPYGGVNSIKMRMDGKTGAKYATSYAPETTSVYACGWTMNGDPEYYYYYATSPEHAYYLRTNDGSISDASFEDLRAPLQKGATWSFADASGNMVAAHVEGYGIHMRYKGIDYADAVEVSYTSVNRTVMKLFARDVGLVYAISMLPDGSVENKIELQELRHPAETRLAWDRSKE